MVDEENQCFRMIKNLNRNPYQKMSSISNIAWHPTQNEKFAVSEHDRNFAIWDAEQLQ